MKLVLLLNSLLLAGVLAACGSETPTAPPSPTATAPAPTVSPTATPGSTTTPAPVPSPTPAAQGGEDAGEPEPPGIPIQGGVLKLLGADPPTLDPHQSADSTSSRYISEIFGGLLTINTDLAIAPDLSESWEISSNGQIFTFRLNPSATFHDGRKVTADDFRWSLERAADPATESPSADIFLGDIVGAMDKLKGEARSIAGISVIDEQTLRLEIDAPKAYFPSKMTYATAFVVDPANVETGQQWVREPNGTGPFMLADYEPGVLMRLERFDGYHLGPAILEAVEFNLAGGDRLLMYENDELHFGNVGVAGLEMFGDPTNPLHNQLHQAPPGFDTTYIGMNVNEPPFDDPNIRLALNYAIDRERLIAMLLEDTVAPARGILPPGFPGYNADLDSYEFNPEKARQLLAESKYGSDTANYPAITMTMPGSFGSPVDPMMQAILLLWEEQLGITMDILQTEWATYLQDLRQGRFQIFGGLGWIADYADPENFLDVLFHSSSSNNHTYYYNPELDALLEQARVEQDQAARFAMYREAEQIILDDAPWVPLYHSGGNYYLIKPYVKGLEFTALLIPYLRHVYFTE